MDLTNDGRVHQCIFSVGQDPMKIERPILSREKKHSGLFDHLSADVYSMKSKASSDKIILPSTENVQALNFSVDKSLKSQFSEEDCGKIDFCILNNCFLNAAKDEVFQILRLLKYDFHLHCIRTLLILWLS